MKFNEKAMRVHNISVGKDLSGRTRWCAPTMTLLTFLEPNCDFDAIALRIIHKSNGIIDNVVYNSDGFSRIFAFNMNNDNLILISPRPIRADAVKNRRLLLDTARRLFDERGVEVVCMSDIAEAAGVGKGTLYRHFANKGELCHALLDDDQRDLQEHTLERLRTFHEPLQNLRWFLPEVLAFVERNSPLLRAGMIDADGIILDQPAHRWWRQTIRGLLQAMHVQGDIDYFSDVLYTMLDVNVFYYQRHALGYSFERIINGLLDTLDRLIA